MKSRFPLPQYSPPRFRPGAMITLKEPAPRGLRITGLGFEDAHGRVTFFRHDAIDELILLILGVQIKGNKGESDKLRFEMLFPDGHIRYGIASAKDWWEKWEVIDD